MAVLEEDKRTYLTRFDDLYCFYAQDTIYQCDADFHVLNTISADVPFSLNEKKAGYDCYGNEFPQLYQTYVFEHENRQYHIGTIFSAVYVFEKSRTYPLCEIPLFQRRDRVYNKLAVVDSHVFLSNGRSLYEMKFHKNSNMEPGDKLTNKHFTIQLIREFDTLQLRVHSLRGLLIIRDVQQGRIYQMGPNNTPVQAVFNPELEDTMNVLLSTDDCMISSHGPDYPSEQHSINYLTYVDGQLVFMRGNSYHKPEYKLNKFWELTDESCLQLLGKTYQEFIRETEEAMKHRRDIYNKLFNAIQTHPTRHLFEDINISAFVPDHRFWLAVLNGAISEFVPRQSLDFAISYLSHTWNQAQANALIQQKLPPLTVNQLLDLLRLVPKFPPYFRVEFDESQQSLLAMLQQMRASDEELHTLAQMHPFPLELFLLDSASNTYFWTPFLKYQPKETVEYIFLMATNTRRVGYIIASLELLPHNRMFLIAAVDKMLTIYQYILLSLTPQQRSQIPDRLLDKFKKVEASSSGITNLMVGAMIDDVDMCRQFEHQTRRRDQNGMTALGYAVQQAAPPYKCLYYLATLEVDVQIEPSYLILAIQHHIHPHTIKQLFGHLTGKVTTDGNYAALEFARTFNAIDAELLSQEKRLVFALPNRHFKNMIADITLFDDLTGVSLHHRYFWLADGNMSANAEKDYFLRSPLTCYANGGENRDVFGRNHDMYKALKKRVDTKFHLITHLSFPQ